MSLELARDVLLLQAGLPVAGEAISVQAQAIVACDAYDTMTADRRVYHASTMGVADALNEMCACAGKQFGAQVTREFIEMEAGRGCEMKQSLRPSLPGWVPQLVHGQDHIDGLRTS